MNNELPVERQPVLVRLDNQDWQSATFQYGQFVDVYGLPLDRHKISSWRPMEGGADGEE